MADPIAPTPEAEHLAEQEQLLGELTERVAAEEADFATLGAEFARFRVTYLARFAPLYAELDRLDAEIARLLAGRLPPEGTEAEAARARAAEAEARAAESASAAEDAERQPEAPPAPSAELRSLYHLLAKAIHPDLADAEEERARRTERMAAANAAYAAGDEAALRRLWEDEQARPEAISGDDVGARLIRVLRKIAQVRRRFTELAELRGALEGDAMWALFDTVRAQTGQGGDPLGAIETGLRAKIGSARAQLTALRAAEPRDPGGTAAAPRASEERGSGRAPGASSGQGSVDEIRLVSVHLKTEQTRTVRAAADVVSLMAAFDFLSEAQESLWVIAIDYASHVRTIARVFRHGPHGGNVQIGPILTIPLLASCTCFIVVHNHPSGSPSPSEEDEILTREIAEAASIVGLEFEDHIIITPQGDAYSMKHGGSVAPAADR
ncbi:MAG: JAB domain-containing protein [Candidatus Limnocylindrales bacterium]